MHPSLRTGCGSVNKTGPQIVASFAEVMSFRLIVWDKAQIILTKRKRADKANLEILLVEHHTHIDTVN